MPQFIEYFLLSYTWTVRKKGTANFLTFPENILAPPLPLFFSPSLINLLNFPQHWNNCMYFLFSFPRQNISQNYYWLKWRPPIQNFQDTSHKILTFWVAQTQCCVWMWSVMSKSKVVLEKQTKSQCKPLFLSSNFVYIFLSDPSPIIVYPCH